MAGSSKLWMNRSWSSFSCFRMCSSRDHLCDSLQAAYYKENKCPLCMALTHYHSLHTHFLIRANLSSNICKTPFSFYMLLLLSCCTFSLEGTWFLGVHELFSERVGGVFLALDISLNLQQCRLGSSTLSSFAGVKI